MKGLDERTHLDITGHFFWSPLISSVSTGYGELGPARLQPGTFWQIKEAKSEVAMFRSASVQLRSSPRTTPAANIAMRRSGRRNREI